MGGEGPPAQIPCILYLDSRNGSNAPALERAWGVEGPFWARHYVFWAGGEPLCVIYEVFSPKLERFVGPQE